MSFNTPLKPATDRSSVTPPDRDDSQDRRGRRVGPRMKPQSEAYKKRMYERSYQVALDQKRLVRQAQRQKDKPVWLDLDSDDAGAGPLAKDDAVYHGRSARSRIASVQAARDGETAPGDPHDAGDNPVDTPEPPPCGQPTSPAQPRLQNRQDLETSGSSRKRSTKTFKTPETIDTSDDEDDREMSAKRSRVDDASAQRTRHTRPFGPSPDWLMLRSPSPPVPSANPMVSPPPLPPMEPDPRMPTVLELFNGGDLVPSATGDLEWLDDEAIESGSDRDVERGEPEHKLRRSARLDEYDLDDPFINDDDDSERSESSVEHDDAAPVRPSTQRLSSPFASRPHSNGRRAQLLVEYSDSDGVELSDSRRRLHRERPSTASKEKASARPLPRPVHKTLEGSVSTQSAKSKHADRTDGSGARFAKTDATSTVPSKGAQVKQASLKLSNKEKGKGRALSSPSPEQQSLRDDLGTDVEEMSDWERKQFELAIVNSKRDKAFKTPSGSQGSSLSTPQATALFTSTSPSLSTPQASALFSTPSAQSRNDVSPSPLAGSKGPKDRPLTIAELVQRARGNAEGSNATTEQTPAVLPAPAPVTNANVVRLVMRCTPADIPTRCHCTIPSLIDPVLAQQYEGLVPLLPGHIEPWGHVPGPGSIRFSAWAEQCPSMSAAIALGAVDFKQKDHLRNLSRSSPLDAGLYAVPGQSDRFNIYCTGTDPVPLVAVTTGMLEDSQLTTVSESGLRQKWVRVILHAVEDHRYKGWVRMVTGHESLHAQYNKHAFQFSTRPMLRSLNNPNGKNKYPSKKDNKGLRVNPSKMFSNDSAAGGSGNRLSADNFSLPAEATVPVYDARGLSNYDFTENLPRLAETLPTWTQGEIPYGSFVMVGHTLSLYRSLAGNWTLGLNLQWVIVIGTPEDD